MFSYIAAIIAGIATIVLDQISKFYILSNFELNYYRDFLPGLIDLTFIENGGGAWGMLSGYTWVLLLITAIVMVVCVAILIKIGFKNKLMFWSICLVLGGGIGNMIDRIFRDGKVVDFLHFTFWPQFPVFNIADIAIVIGAGLLILYYIKSMINDSKKAKKANGNDELEKNEKD